MLFGREYRLSYMVRAVAKAVASGEYDGVF